MKVWICNDNFGYHISKKEFVYGRHIKRYERNDNALDAGMTYMIIHLGDINLPNNSQSQFDIEITASKLSTHVIEKTKQSVKHNLTTEAYPSRWFDH